LLAKTLARLGGIDYSTVLQGHKGAKAKIDEALALVWERRSAERLAYLHDTGSLTLEAIQEQARAHFARYAEAEAGGPGLLVIDYLQRLARSLRQTPWQGLELREAVTRFTMLLRDIANELDCTVLALASQNRASGYGAAKDNNMLASAKESGDIEYTADVILALGKEEQDTKLGVGHKAIPLHLVKNRLGGLDTITLDWYGARQQFTRG
jgi:replicative DNA helicase